MAYYDALVDSTTRSVLAVSEHRSAVIFVYKCTADTKHIPFVNFPHYPDPFFLLSYPIEDYPKWAWTGKGRLLEQTKDALVPKETLARVRLANEKLKLISQIITDLNIARQRIGTGIEFQETVYLTKKTQAQQFKDSGYDEESVIEYPFVLQYADLAGITPRQATDDILFKAQLSDDVLAKTELLRLKYFRRVKAASKPEQMSIIREEFMRDFFVNANV